jgi:hypothetical protein
LRSFSQPFDLRRFGRSWLIAEKNLWHIPEALDRSRHVAILSPRQLRTLRRADPIEITAGKITQWTKR